MGNTDTLDRYLCAILELRGKYFCIRSVDVAHYLACSKPSVSAAVRQLAEEGFLQVEPDGHLTLTPAGEARAQSHCARCGYFQGLLTAAGVDPALARQEAQALSRALSPASFDALKSYMEHKEALSMEAGAERFTSA